ncbi:MAG: hypothetical protein PHI98_09730 [Eubacteriales bacterium]|nr:hypothetical protein [Eubacteriales bacterium]
MQQRYSWMRPALQTSEAVLLPALLKRQYGEPRYSDRYTRVKAAEDPFRPVPQEGEPVLALSTYVRPRGSMAGRSVLRAAGVSGSPFSFRGKPRYYAQSQSAMQSRWRSR